MKGLEKENLEQLIGIEFIYTNRATTGWENWEQPANGYVSLGDADVYQNYHLLIVVQLYIHTET